jgi:hypothetical protein
MGKIPVAWFRFIAIYMYILIVASGSLLEMILHGVNDVMETTQKQDPRFLFSGKEH